MAVIDEGVHRQQLDRGDAQRLDVIDHFSRAHAGIRALQLGRNRRMQLGKALYMGLINNRIVPGQAVRARLAMPVEIRIDHHALGHEGRAVALIEAQIIAFGADGVAKTLRTPLELTGVAAGVRV